MSSLRDTYVTDGPSNSYGVLNSLLFEGNVKALLEK